MTRSFASNPAARDERGSARLKLVIVLVVVGLVGYMGFQYVPVAYQAYTFKKFMGESAEKAAASYLPADQKGSWVDEQLRSNGKDYGVPPDAKISHNFADNRMTVTVKFTRHVRLLPGFTYDYIFDHTVNSGTFLTAH
jgi:hypothetical protein